MRCGSTIASMLLVAIAVMGCSSDDRDIADEAVDDGAVLGEDLANDADAMLGPEDALTRMEIAGGIMLAIDDGEILQAEAALDVVSDPFVIDFALEMIDVHTLHAEETESILFSNGAVPVESDITVKLAADTDAIVDRVLTSFDPDFVYMQDQIVMHEQARILVTELAFHTDDTELGPFLSDTAFEIAIHRDDAISILRGL